MVSPNSDSRQSSPGQTTPDQYPQLTDIRDFLQIPVSTFRDVIEANQNGGVEHATLAEVAAQLEHATSSIRRLIGPQKEVQIGIFDGKDAQVFERCAELYQDNQYSGPDGEVNPNDPRYQKGGAHFKRDAQWFKDQLTLDGARLAIAECDDEVVGYSLFFTEPAAFPSFADEVQRYSNVPGVEKIAYTYLFVVEDSERSQGIAKQLLQETISECREAGCDLLTHEFFVRPQLNLNSALFHIFHLQSEYGAVDTGFTASHTIERASGDRPADVYYAHWVIPTNAGDQFLVGTDGSWKMEKAH
ncbi:MAG: GNAT family N-acetyltransferase [Bdellovibrionales bacterium]|nr:GNAT family N-acetyltransferase [Bdellovibrionales bacterium]